MSTSTSLNVNQKGSVALVLIIVVIVIGLAVGAYLITQKTSWFSNAGSAQITIPYQSPAPTTAQTTYENPFDSSTTNASYTNPFESTTYQNPFEDL